MQKKGPQVEQDSMSADRSSENSTTTERANNSSPKRDRKVSGSTELQQSTGGPLDIIAHCADNSYKHRAMKDNMEENENEVEDEFSHTSFSNKSKDETNSTDAEEHYVEV
jgi:hypothetical protein